jgi:hypothetical protein
LFECIGLFPLIRARIDASRLAGDGISTQALVFYPGYDTEFSYFVVNLHRLSFRFSANDPETGQVRTFGGSQFVSGDTWLRLTTGDYVTVSYLPSDPRVSRLTGSDSDNIDLDDSLIYLAVLGPPIVFGLWEGLSWLRKIESQNTKP